MILPLDTTAWERVHKTKPSGCHYWRFEAETPEVRIAIETDGPFKRARDRVLRELRDAHGPDLKVRLVP